MISFFETSALEEPALTNENISNPITKVTSAKIPHNVVFGALCRTISQ